MRDAKSLLDQFLGQVDLSSVTGGAQPGSGQAARPGAAPAAPGGGSLNLGGLNLDSMLSGKGGLATGAVAGGLAGLLIGGKKPKKIAKTALQAGGAALIGGLAYKAWRDYQAGRPPGGGPDGTPPQAPSGSGGGGATFGNAAGGAYAPSPAPLPIEDASGTGFLPEAPDEQEALSQALIAAMIGAAKADGHVTDEERQRIATALERLEIAGDQRAFIAEELAKPLDVGAIAASAKTEEQRIEVYAASLIAVDPEGPAEKGYLAMLAARLELDPALVDHLHANADRLLAG
ncbi:MAG: tellurite resistance TerB family protein [Devosiaceae bacterium]|nr:tellurite resistance TerB family protein [Devosiaceae bacterium MH13]